MALMILFKFIFFSSLLDTWPFFLLEKKISCFFQYGWRIADFLVLLNAFKYFTDEFYCLQTSEHKHKTWEKQSKLGHLMSSQLCRFGYWC